MFIRIRCGAVVSMCLSAGTLVAQNPTATLVGTIRDATGAVVADVALEVRNTDPGDIRRAVAAARGEFTVPNLRPGPYEVTLPKAGFPTGRQTNIVLLLEQAAPI